MSKPKFRSKLEEQVDKRMKQAGIKAEFEPVKIEYTYNYIPDFVFKGAYIEVKGLLSAEDMRKYYAVKKSNPDIQLIFVFAAPNKIVPRRKITHAEWADKNGFKWFSQYEMKNLKQYLDHINRGM